MEKLLTTAELAEAIGASDSSMRRWTNSGLIRTSRTAGGHRRIALSEAIRFVRESGSTVVRPDMLGLPELPAAAGLKWLGDSGAERTLLESLQSGNQAAAVGCVAGLYLNGMGVPAICDGPIQSAMHRIGELWPHDPRAILIEHRAVNICLAALGALRQMMPPPAENAPVALGGAAEGDPFQLPSMMAAMVVAEAGFRDTNFGPDTPLGVLEMAAAENQAKLVWLALKSNVDSARMRMRIDQLVERLAPSGAHLVVGGTGADSLQIHSAKNLHVMRTMTELSAFAREMSGSAPSTPMAATP